jgi:hypothetical protein
MTGDPARLRLLEFLLWTEHTVGERAGASAPQNGASALPPALSACVLDFAGLLAGLPHIARRLQPVRPGWIEGWPRGDADHHCDAE